MKSKLLLELLNNSSRGSVDIIRKGIRHRLPSDLSVILLFTAMTLMFVFLPLLEETPGRIIFGLPMILFIPGYALIAALFPGKDDLDPIERAALSFGLSIAVVPLIGLGLNFTPWGIRLVPILVSLTIFVLIMVLAAHFRRLKLEENKRFDVKFKEIYISFKQQIFIHHENRTDRILTIILFISIIATLVMLVYVIVTPKQGEKFTEFYILGMDGKARGYPVNLTVGKTDSVIVGIVNHEYEDVNYKLEVKLNEDILGNKNIVLAHNQTWEELVNFTPQHAGERMKLQFLLYARENFTEAYRNTHLWVNVGN